ncbi:divisome protein SepX/GlpR [Mycobacterium sp.]|uniref:divisome protein SepX/GlpR n=1 Tax=Mycobacterium sp. TaxID=1785 RepID=UPI003D6C464B
MPSIPQSLLWISLVVLWLFVLVPMLISKRDAVRRTSDVALATRVLNSAAAVRLLRRGGPAAGHRSDPHWQHDERQYDVLDDDVDEPSGAVVAVAAAVVDEPGPDYLDVDVVDEDSGALSVGDSAAADAEVEEAADDDAETESMAEHAEDAVFEEVADEYETVDDTSGIPVAEEQSESMLDPAISRRHRYESQTAAAVGARKYTFRKRMLMAMAMALVASAAAAFVLTPTAWWVCGGAGAVTVLYLAYLRRQTRIEARVQRRRMQRMARSRLGVENTRDREFDVVPSRLRRPGTVVLEIDDEDPAFEHLDYAPYARDYGWHRDLPRAVGQ